jgi:hypothetical protein
MVDNKLISGNGKKSFSVQFIIYVETSICTKKSFGNVHQICICARNEFVYWICD